MSDILTISNADILQQVKISCLIPSLIEEIIGRNVVARFATEQRVLVEAEQLQQTADGLRLANGLQSAEQTWRWLEKHHLSLDEFEEIAYATTLSAKLAQRLFADQVEPFYLEHQLDYAQVVMREVVLDDADIAMELFYALQEGEISFFEIADQRIPTRELRYTGGYRGPLRRIDLKPEIAAAVFAAVPPTVLKPITTSQGAHLIRVEEILQPQLDQTLHQQILASLYSDWLKRQIAQTQIAIAS
jgi:parvulin-like peptidyl-prolyl isomerase